MPAARRVGDQQTRSGERRPDPLGRAHGPHPIVYGTYCMARIEREPWRWSRHSQRNQSAGFAARATDWNNYIGLEFYWGVATTTISTS